MNNFAGVLLATTLAGMLLIAAWLGFSYIHYNNRAVELENRFKPAIQKVQGTFDNVWRIIEGKAHVSEKYKNGVRELLEAQQKGREGGSLMKSVQEALPGLDPSLYRDVSNAIESQRTGFLNAEVEVLAIKQEHDNLRMQMPSSFFVSGHPELVYKVITSSRTEKVFETGKDESSSDPFSK